MTRDCWCIEANSGFEKVDILVRNTRSMYGKPVQCWKRNFISHFLLTCIDSRNWSPPPHPTPRLVLSSLFNSAFRFEIFEGLNGQAAVSGWWDISVESVKLGPLGATGTFTGSEWAESGMKLLQSPAQYPWSVCKSDCLLLFTICGKRLVTL